LKNHNPYHILYICLVWFNVHTKKKMSNEIAKTFQSQIESNPIPDNFKDFWQSTWKPITKKCLNVAKHIFVMRKAFELFKSNFALCKFQNQTNWHVIFNEEKEAEILESLCKHVNLDFNHFIYFGINFHRNRCKTYYTTNIS